MHTLCTTINKAHPEKIITGNTNKEHNGRILKFSDTFSLFIKLQLRYFYGGSETS